MWIKKTLDDYVLKFKSIPIYCDITSGINLSPNPIQYSKTKHIDSRHQFSKPLPQCGFTKLDYN